MMHAPKFALEVASYFIALVIVSFLADCGVTDIVNATLCCPSPTTIKHIIFDEAVDTILLENKRMKNKNLPFLAIREKARAREVVQHHLSNLSQCIMQKKIALE